MHRAGVLVGTGRRPALGVEEPGATASSTFVGSRVDGADDRFSVDDGADQATTTTMIYVKKECDMDDDEDSKHQVLCLQQSNENENVSPLTNWLAVLYQFGSYFTLVPFIMCYLTQGGPTFCSRRTKKLYYYFYILFYNKHII